jgi:hypothetical protein
MTAPDAPTLTPSQARQRIADLLEQISPLEQEIGRIEGAFSARGDCLEGDLHHLKSNGCLSCGWMP